MYYIEAHGLGAASMAPWPTEHKTVQKLHDVCAFRQLGFLLKSSMSSCWLTYFNTKVCTYAAVCFICVKE